MALARTSRSESGFALIEVIVSAAVLAMVSLAVLSGLDASQASSAREKARAVASTLAEQDQERLRSMTVESLAALPGTAQTVKVDGVQYAVTSKAEWITDDTGGTPSCGNSSKQSEYLHITSTVASKIIGVRTDPVKIESLSAPSVAYSQNHGTLGVKVVDRNGVGIKDINVHAASPSFSPPDDETDQAGCVLFRSVPIGSYAITVDTAGYVGEAGVQRTTAEQTVSPNTVSFKTVPYDRAVRGRATIRTWTPGQAAPTAATGGNASRALAISDNSAQTGVLRSFPAVATTTPQATIDTTNLYPFGASPYGFYTGRCAYESPRQFDTNAWSSTLGKAASLVSDPTKPQPQPITVFQPPLNLRINTTSTIRVFMTLQKPTGSTDSCTDLQQYEMALTTYPSSGWNPAPAVAPNDTQFVMQPGLAAGTYDFGMPYGKYDVCVQRTTTHYTTTYDNTLTTAHPLVTVSPTWSTGTC